MQTYINIHILKFLPNSSFSSFFSLVSSSFCSLPRLTITLVLHYTINIGISQISYNHLRHHLTITTSWWLLSTSLQLMSFNSISNSLFNLFSHPFIWFFLHWHSEWANWSVIANLFQGFGYSSRGVAEIYWLTVHYLMWGRWLG